MSVTDLPPLTTHPLRQPSCPRSWRLGRPAARDDVCIKIVRGTRNQNVKKPSLLAIPAEEGKPWNTPVHCIVVAFAGADTKVAPNKAQAGGSAVLSDTATEQNPWFVVQVHIISCHIICNVAPKPQKPTVAQSRSCSCSRKIGTLKPE